MSGPFIAVIDLETTGFAPPAEIIEIACSAVMASSDLLGDADWTEASVAAPYAVLVRASQPIPPETSAVHHLIAEDLADALPWGLIAPGWAAIARGAVALAAHSASFERQWLTPELGFAAPWICTYKCALRAWPEAPGHSNQTLRYWLKPPSLRRGLAMPAHRAGPDAYVTAHLLRELLRLHTLDELIRWSGEPALLVRVPFGKSPPAGCRGMKWSEVDDGLLEWVLGTDMGEDVLFTAAQEIERRRAARSSEGPDDFRGANAEDFA